MSKVLSQATRLFQALLIHFQALFLHYRMRVLLPTDHSYFNHHFNHYLQAKENLLD
jgi:hypothetical protein